MARKPMFRQVSTRSGATFPRFSDSVTGDMSSAEMPTAFAFIVSVNSLLMRGRSSGASCSYKLSACSGVSRPSSYHWNTCCWPASANRARKSANRSLCRRTGRRHSGRQRHQSWWCGRVAGREPLEHEHTQVHTHTRTHTHACTHAHMHTRARMGQASAGTNHGFRAKVNSTQDASPCRGRSAPAASGRLVSWVPCTVVYVVCRCCSCARPGVGLGGGGGRASGGRAWQHSELQRLQPRATSTCRRFPSDVVVAVLRLVPRS